MDQKIIYVMKKFLVFISILAAAISCETMYGPVQTPLKADKAQGIEIKVNAVDDNTASFTLTPAGEASYYSYLVDASETVVAVDSSLLLSCKYTSVAQGTVKWTKEEASATIELEELMPNTTYQIYAVAASPMGFVSSVVTTSFKTSDKVAPVLASEAWEITDNVATLVFSEAVLLGEGKITANYYAYNDPAFAEAKHIGTVEADAKKVVVEGNTVTVEFDGLPQGAFYAVNYPEGMFKDASGNKAAELKSAMILDSETWETAGVGVYGQRDLGTYEFGALNMESLAEWQTPLLVDFGSEYGYGYTLNAAAGTAVFSHAGKVTTVALTRNVDFGYASSAGALVIYLPEEPARGDVVTVTIAAESFEDFYGNLNEEWTTSFVYSYGYTLADVVGDYMAEFTSMLNGQPSAMALSIAEVTAEDIASKYYIEGCNVKLTKLLLPAVMPIYAHFDVDGGLLTIPSYQMYGMSGDQSQMYAFMTITGGSADTGSPTVLSMPESGVITAGSSTFGIYVFDAASGSGLGWGAAVSGLVATRTPAAGTAAMSLSRDLPVYPLGTELIVK